MGNITKDQVSVEYHIGAVKLTAETANKMTQVARIFEEEKQQVIRGVKQQSVKEIAGIVNIMIKKGYSTEEIIAVAPGYFQHDVEMLRKELEEETFQAV